MIRFYEKRKWFFGLSALIMLIGIVGIFIRGIEMDIQFTGGSIIKYSFEGEIDTDRAAALTEETLGRNANAMESVTTIKSDSGQTKNQKLLVLDLSGTQNLTQDEQDKLNEALSKEFKDQKLAFFESTNVPPFIGAQFMRRSIIAVVLSSVLIVLYVWWSFRKIGGLSAGVMALVALLHDVIVVFFTFVLFGIPLNDGFIAVVLTILGFSINDTIVIYDRIRENKSIMGFKTPIRDIVNKSITQSLTRSINTNIATFLSVLSVYIFSTVFGIESVRNFSLPLMTGVVSGCYSTIFIAGPLWVMWQQHKEKKRAKAKA